METVTIPTSKIGKVSWLLNIAKELGILNDQKNEKFLIYNKMFDKLMDKYEKNLPLFDFMFEEINTCIISKDPIEATKLAFIACLEAESFHEIGKFLTKVNKKSTSGNERLYF